MPPFDGEHEIDEVLSKVFHCTVSPCNNLLLINFRACFPFLALRLTLREEKKNVSFQFLIYPGFGSYLNQFELHLTESHNLVFGVIVVTLKTVYYSFVFLVVESVKFRRYFFFPSQKFQQLTCYITPFAHKRAVTQSRLESTTIYWVFRNWAFDTVCDSNIPIFMLRILSWCLPINVYINFIK